MVCLAMDLVSELADSVGSPPWVLDRDLASVLRENIDI